MYGIIAYDLLEVGDKRYDFDDWLDNNGWERVDDVESTVFRNFGRVDRDEAIRLSEEAIQKALEAAHIRRRDERIVAIIAASTTRPTTGHSVRGIWQRD